MGQIAGHAMTNGFRDRVKAWWHGYDADEDPDAVGGKAGAGGASRAGQEEPVAEIPMPSGLAEWTPQRVVSLQRLFGAGCDSPPAAEWLSPFITPLGLNEQMTVLEVGARLGDGARCIAKETGAWVDGIDAHDALIDEATRLSAVAGLAKKAVVRKLGLTDPEIREHKRDAIISRESLHLVGDRERLFQNLRDLLKPSSHLMFTDFMVVPGKGREARSEWSSLHRSVPQLFELDELRERLLKLGFDVRVAKDETKTYMRLVLKAIQGLGPSLAEEPIAPELREWLMWEVEYWARTFSALEAGGMAVYRIHAVTMTADPTRG
jgi:SAM-dependent methyltransferase